jgi:hypothetical protein
MALTGVVILVLKLADKKPKPTMLQTGRLVLGLSASGLFAFLTGMGLLFLPELGRMNLGLALVGGGFLTLLGSTFLNVALLRRRRAAWPIVWGHCTDRQLQRKAFWSDNGSRTGWLWRLVCELDYGGKHYVLSPMIHWSDLAQRNAAFWSEEEAHRFIAQKVSPDGECKLRVNPDNPIEAELL